MISEEFRQGDQKGLPTRLNNININSRPVSKSITTPANVSRSLQINTIAKAAETPTHNNIHTQNSAHPQDDRELQDVPYHIRAFNNRNNCSNTASPVSVLQEQPSDSAKGLLLAEMTEKASQGDKVAQNTLGEMYKDGRGVLQNNHAAMEWFLKAADQGCPFAQYNIGNLYLFGRGVTHDKVEAVHWHLKAAEHDHAAAQNKLGSMYRDGHGVLEDPSEAMIWYHKAAEQDFGHAQLNLAAMYCYSFGVARDYSQAMLWLRKAADQGLGYAKYKLGLMYKEGLGVPKDRVRAMELHREAFKHGHRASAMVLKKKELDTAKNNEKV
ncbi:hypothetical protein BGZ95_003113 [Linnemannia exigua]|uniref:HCP-like protein n=1 Tax=Linnemannia exigua TaxID=604196 RepID=A0AAD4H2I0_9FUNG|nr:hypothetical protein BGZ95_003113 [Linnemannia exigua]